MPAPGYIPEQTEAQKKIRDEIFKSLQKSSEQYQKFFQQKEKAL